MGDHIVKSYDVELERLTGEIVRMGEIAVHQVRAAIDALQRRDTRNAERVVANDAAIDSLEHEVSHDVLRLLALRHPIARDLRDVMAALRIASDIERIGDYAANVAKRSMVLNLTPEVAAANRLGALADIAAAMLSEVLVSYRERDPARARLVRERDAELDDLYTALFRELLTYMMEEPRTITACAHLLFMAKNLERIGDHVTNIAENVYFLVTGENLPAERAKRDLTSSPPAD
jgi:phosphate transport system protein